MASHIKTIAKAFISNRQLYDSSPTLDVMAEIFEQSDQYVEETKEIWVEVYAFLGISRHLTGAPGAVVTSVQALNGNLLTVPWQQGLVEVLVLVIAQGLCQLGQRRLMTLLTWVFLAYMSMIVLLGFAGLVWVAGGHAVQGDFSAHGWQVSTANYPVFATVIVSLLGMAVPLNLGAEVMNQRAGGRYLRWGVIVTVVGYLVATFGVLVVLPPSTLRIQPLSQKFLASPLGLSWERSLESSTTSS